MTDEQILAALIRIARSAASDEELTKALSAAADKFVSRVMDELATPETLAAIVMSVLASRGYQQATFMGKPAVVNPRVKVPLPVLSAFKIEMEAAIHEVLARGPSTKP